MPGATSGEPGGAPVPPPAIAAGGCSRAAGRARRRLQTTGPGTDGARGESPVSRPSLLEVPGMGHGPVSGAIVRAWATTSSKSNQLKSACLPAATQRQARAPPPRPGAPCPPGAGLSQGKQQQADRKRGSARFPAAASPTWRPIGQAGA